MNYILDFIQQGGVIAYVLVAMNFVGTTFTSILSSART